MKKYTIFLFLALSFSILHTNEAVDAKKMPDFFYIAVWSEIWKAYETHHENDMMSLFHDDSPLIVTTFIPLHQEKKQLRAYIKRLNETSEHSYFGLKVKTDALCNADEIPNIFSKDRFDHYRFNKNNIPTKAIVEAEPIIEKP